MELKIGNTKNYTSVQWNTIKLEIKKLTQVLTRKIYALYYKRADCYKHLMLNPYCDLH